MIRHLFIAAIACSFSLSLTAQDTPAKEVTVKIAPTNPMAYETTTFTVKAGEKIKLTIDNQANFPQPHNFVLVKPGTEAKVGGLAAAFVADLANQFKHNFIPESTDILAHTKLVGFNQKDVVEFTAPTEAGDYPYICTYVGHWAAMKGIMKVEP